MQSFVQEENAFREQIPLDIFYAVYNWFLSSFLSTPDMFDDLFTQHSFSSYILVSFSTGKAKE